MREEYTVKLRRPEGVSIAEMARYIRIAMLEYTIVGPESVHVFRNAWKDRGRNSIHVKKK